MLEQMGKQAKDAAFILAQLNTTEKNHALSIIADQLEQQAERILAANQKDIEVAKQNGLSEALIDRLLLTEDRLKGIANDVRHVISLADPVGKIIDGCTLDSGLKIERVRTPLGVIGTIYEARPNVTIDVASLCLKTGNAVILRGGKETQHSNQILVEVVQNALEQAGLPRHAVQAITDPNRELVMQLLKLDRYVDMIIPRGGAGLHELCKQHSTIPVIVGGVGVFHAKSTALSILQAANVDVQEVTEQALRQEWGSLDLNVVVVEDMDAAIAHIREYGTQHSESILTENQRLATQFINQVDAAAVYVNASTRFTDGGQFGLGAEVAVSTQKLHARGPMGLEALTSYKWVCVGDYTSRK